MQIGFWVQNRNEYNYKKLHNQGIYLIKTPTIHRKKAYAQIKSTIDHNSPKPQHPTHTF